MDRTCGRDIGPLADAEPKGPVIYSEPPKRVSNVWHNPPSIRLHIIPSTIPGYFYFHSNWQEDIQEYCQCVI